MLALRFAPQLDTFCKSTYFRYFFDSPASSLFLPTTRRQRVQRGDPTVIFNHLSSVALTDIAKGTFCTSLKGKVAKVMFLVRGSSLVHIREASDKAKR